MKCGDQGIYREIPLKYLGNISPLSPKQKNQIPDSPLRFELENREFRVVPQSKKSLYRQAAIDKEKITPNIATFIDGFELSL